MCSRPQPCVCEAVCEAARQRGSARQCEAGRLQQQPYRMRVRVLASRLQQQHEQPYRCGHGEVAGDGLEEGEVECDL